MGTPGFLASNAFAASSLLLENGYPLDSSSSRSDVMMVAVGFNPRIGSRDIARSRVATVENKPRAIGQPGHFNRRYATNGGRGALRSVG